ncbi:MAG: threonine--tRNA ligase [Bacteroidia bacterium]
MTILTHKKQSLPITLQAGETGENLLKNYLPHADNVLGVKVDGIIQDLKLPIPPDSKEVIFLTWEDPEGKFIFWHSSAHILAEALEALYPHLKLTIGPPIEEGFYYDIDFSGGPHPTPEDFPRIEKKFLELAAQSETFERRHVSKAQALAFYQARHNPYKIELIQELEDGNITFYHSGNFVDLCKGPHLPNSSFIKAVKVLRLSGAYWRGNSQNPQLTRVYAISFPSQAQLEEYLLLLQEAHKRDHRVLGKKLDLFSFHEEGVGFPFWHPNGMIVLNGLQSYMRKLLLQKGYQEIKTPILLHAKLWHQSGHYENYKENMYFTHVDEEAYAVKPMNCPGSTLVYRTRKRSYRELPLRLFEFGLVHRHELSGVLTGLFRVRAFTQDDAHIYCTPDQIQEEIHNLIQLTRQVYETFGFSQYDVFLSTRPERYIGDLALWEQAESALAHALKAAEQPYQTNPGDGAFYGPKIDFVVRDNLKRRWQLGTIQLDFSMPKRFGLEYIGKDNQPHTPVMIHRAILGSFERFIGILIEHTGGEFPGWLTPVQVAILPISEKFIPYAENVAQQVRKQGYRAVVDTSDEKLGKKVRNAEEAHIPLLVIIGSKEMETQTVSLRYRPTRTQKDQVSLHDFFHQMETLFSIPLYE